MRIEETALIVIDVQNDFCTGGKLAVTDGEQVVPAINSIRDIFNTVVFTKDWHPEGHKSFASTHKAPIFSEVNMPYGKQTVWPNHCVQGTKGAELHADLIVKESDIIINKGTNTEIDSYSAFKENDKVSAPKFDNGKTLAEELKNKGIKTLVFGGLAGDYCVGFSIEDALAEKFNVVVVRDAVKSINEDAFQAKLDKMVKENGVKVVTSKELKAQFVK